MTTPEAVVAELEEIARRIEQGAPADEAEPRMRTAHDALLALGGGENRGRAVTVALLVAALRGGAPAHVGMAQKLRAIADDLRGESARGGEGG